MSTAKPKHSLSVHIGMIISVIALLLSITTFYYSNFYVRDTLIARFPGTMELKTDSGNYNNMTLKLVLINTGNRPGVILGAGYMLSGSGKNQGAFGDEMSVDSIPFILKPDQVRFFEIPLSGKYMGDNFSSGDTTVASHTNVSHAKLSAFYLTVHFSSLNSRGKKFFAQSPELYKFIVSRERGIVNIYPVGANSQSEAVTMELYK